MAYQIHIERDGRVPIPLAEWHDAVERTAGIRLAEGDARATNPHTEEVITVSNSGGDAEVFFPSMDQWLHVFQWHNGKVSFNSLDSFDDPADPVRQAAVTLAAMLGAKIVGEEGETYE